MICRADHRGSGRDGTGDAGGDRAGGRLTAIGRGLALRCPRCGVGPLFRGWFRMHDACAACGASFAREPGFYLGSIYVNYGVTVIATGALYVALVAGFGVSHEAALAVCLAVSVVLPVAFFRHARSLLLALDGAVNRQQSPTGGDAPRERFADLAGDDGRAGCALGVAMALVLLFGLGLAVATVLWSAAVPPVDAESDGVGLSP